MIVDDAHSILQTQTITRSLNSAMADELRNGESIHVSKKPKLTAQFRTESEMKHPKGLLPLSDLVEVGYNRTTGFVWLKQKKKTDHRFRSIGKNVSYETEVEVVEEAETPEGLQRKLMLRHVVIIMDGNVRLMAMLKRKRREAIEDRYSVIVSIHRDGFLGVFDGPCIFCWFEE